jgi:hypothetical protein
MPEKKLTDIKKKIKIFRHELLYGVNIGISAEKVKKNVT